MPKPPSHLLLTPTSTSTFELTSTEGKPSSSLPKLYIFSYKGNPIYVGITGQSIRSRLRYGFKADGKSGYHGYGFRKHFIGKELDLFIWYDETICDPKLLNIETIEAEVVYLIRKNSGKWPEHQTEIHFHQSTSSHKKTAETIFKQIQNFK